MSDHVPDAEWAQWEADRETMNREYADAERDRKRRLLPADVDRLACRVQELEDRLFLTEEVLRCALDLQR